MSREKKYAIISPKLPPGIQVMLENFRWAKEQMNGQLGISQDRVGRTSSGLVQQYANATRDYDYYRKMILGNKRRNWRACRRFYRTRNKSTLRLMLSIIKKSKKY